MKIIKLIAIVVITSVSLLSLLVAIRPQIDFCSALGVVLISTGAVLIACVTVSEVAGPSRVKRRRSFEERVSDMFAHVFAEGSLWGGVGLVYAAGSYNFYLGVFVFVGLAILAALTLGYITTKETVT